MISKSRIRGNSLRIIHKKLRIIRNIYKKANCILDSREIKGSRLQKQQKGKSERKIELISWQISASKRDGVLRGFGGGEGGMGWFWAAVGVLKFSHYFYFLFFLGVTCTVGGFVFNDFHWLWLFEQSWPLTRIVHQQHRFNWTVGFFFSVVDEE